MSETDDLFYTPATELAREIRQGERAPTDVVDAFLSRIDDRNDRSNAFVTVATERARKAAREAEHALDSGDDLGPLGGVPVAIKDLEKVAGVRTTFGSKPFADFVPDENEPFVDRLEDAGAIVLGKTNTPEFGHKGTTDNPLFGPTSTPFAPDRNAGGSSGGSAAAVADGLVPIAQGSDGGGSIRIPSSCCGVFGFKPTYRRIPRVSRPDGFTHTPFSQLGPHARTVADAALLLEVMAGPHPADPLVAPDDGTDFVGATSRSIDGLSIAYSPDLDVFPVDGRVRDVVDAAVGAFESTGASAEETTIGVAHSHGELLETWAAGFRVGFAELAVNLRDEHGVDYLDTDRQDATPEFVELIEAGRAYGAVEYKSTDVVRTTLFDSIQSLFAEHDLLVVPTLAVPPVKNDPENTVGPTEVNGDPVDPLVGYTLTYPFNMTGHPVANLPAGFSNGLPIGLQVVGQRWDDATVLAASAEFERVRPWHDAYPPG